VNSTAKNNGIFILAKQQNGEVRLSDFTIVLKATIVFFSKD